MFNLCEKIQIAFVLVALLAGLLAIANHCNKKMVDACVAGGNSVEYCRFQVTR